MSEGEWWTTGGAASAESSVSGAAQWPVPVPPVQGRPPDGSPPTPGPARRRRRGLIAVAALLVAVAAGGGAWVAFQFFAGGGASSPEGVVTGVLDGVVQQDVAKIASFVDPKELPLLADFLGEANGARKRFSGSRSTDKVAGLQFAVSRVRLSTRELSPDVQRVTVRNGRLRVSGDRSNIPVLLRDAFSVSGSGSIRGEIDANSIADDLGDDLSVVVVRRGRGWFLSPTLTAADLTSRSESYSDTDADFKAFGSSSDFDKGSGSPTQAVEDFADAVASGDPTSVVAALPSEVGQAAVVYGDLFDRLTKEAFGDGSGRLANNWFKVDSFDATESDGPSGMKRVSIDAARFSVEDDDDSTKRFRLDGLRLCEGGGGRGDCSVGLSEPGTPGATRVNTALGGHLDVLVRKSDGGWKVDPFATLLDNGARLLRGTDVSLVRSLVHSTDGAAKRLVPGQRTPIDFDDNGYAVVELTPSKPAVFSVLVEGTGSSDVDTYFTTPFGPERLQNVAESSVAGVVVARPPRQGPLRIGIGGLGNTARSAKVTVAEVPTAAIGPNSPVRGRLSSPVQLYRLPLTNFPTDSSGYHQVNIVSSTTSGTASVGVVDSDQFDAGTVPYLSLEQLAEGPSPASIEGDVAWIAVAGDPGQEFAFRAVPDFRGFEGGATTVDVVVPATTTVTVPLRLGPDYSSFAVDVSWSDPVDVDAELSTGDSNSATGAGPSSFTLSGYGSGEESVRVTGYNNLAPTTVRLTVRFF